MPKNDTPVEMMMLIDITQNQRCLTPPRNIISASRIAPPGYIYSVYVKFATPYLFDKFAKLCRVLASKS